MSGQQVYCTLKCAMENGMERFDRSAHADLATYFICSVHLSEHQAFTVFDLLAKKTLCAKEKKATANLKRCCSSENASAQKSY
jgi:hypothetical protein